MLVSLQCFTSCFIFAGFKALFAASSLSDLRFKCKTIIQPMPAAKSTIAIEHLKFFDINLDVYFTGPPRGFDLATRPPPKVLPALRGMGRCSHSRAGLRISLLIRFSVMIWMKDLKFIHHRSVRVPGIQKLPFHPIHCDIAPRGSPNSGVNTP